MIHGDFPGSQWLRLCAASAGGAGSIPDQGTKIPHASRHGQKFFLKRTNVTNSAKVQSTMSVHR